MSRNKNFCDTCHNLLKTITDDKLEFQCMSCFTKYEPTDDDTLIYEDTKKNNVISHILMYLSLSISSGIDSSMFGKPLEFTSKAKSSKENPLLRIHFTIAIFFWSDNSKDI